MLKDPFTWYMYCSGAVLIVAILFMELTSVAGWINSDFRELAVIFGLAMGLGSVFYAHSRTDHLSTSDAIEELHDVLDELHEDIHNMKDDLQKLRKDFDSRRKT